MRPFAQHDERDPNGVFISKKKDASSRDPILRQECSNPSYGDRPGNRTSNKDSKEAEGVGDIDWGSQVELGM